MRDDVFQDCLYNYRNNAGGTPFWNDLAAKWGYRSGEYLRGVFKNERRRRGIPSKDETPVTSLEKTSYTESGNEIYVVCSSDRIQTKEDVIKEFKVDTEEWVLDSFEIKTSEGYRKDKKVQWEVIDGKATGNVDDSGKLVVVTLYHTKTRFIRKKVQHISLEDVSKLMEEREFSLPAITPELYDPLGEVLEINIMDLHFGSDANHSPEKRLSKAIDDIIIRIGLRKFSKIYLCLLGDIFHYDNLNKTTAKGTPVTTNGMTAYETFDLGLTTITENILKLVSLVPVEVIFIPGNHDPMTGYSLMKVLEAWFKDYNNVTMDCGHKSRKYRLIGKNLVAWMHGDMPKSRAMDWLQVEASEEWGKSKYREIHSGNFHSRETKERAGAILNYLPALTEIDNWHYENGFVGAIKGLMSFVWDENYIGWRDQWFTYVEN